MFWNENVVVSVEVMIEVFIPRGEKRFDKYMKILKEDDPKRIWKEDEPTIVSFFLGRN